MSEVKILGAGDQCKVVISTLRLCGHVPKVAYDDDETKWDSSILGVPIRGKVALAAECDVPGAITAIGDSKARAALVNRMSLSWLSAIHPHSYVDSETEIGAGTVVFAGAIVQPLATVGRHVIINTGATIDHDCKVADYAHIGPGANLCGSVHVEEGAFVATGAVVLPGLRIGAWSIVGAGATVVRDVPPNTKVVGCPARRLHD